MKKSAYPSRAELLNWIYFETKVTQTSRRYLSSVFRTCQMVSTSANCSRSSLRGSSTPRMSTSKPMQAHKFSVFTIYAFLTGEWKPTISTKRQMQRHLYADQPHREATARINLLDAPMVARSLPQGKSHQREDNF